MEAVFVCVILMLATCTGHNGILSEDAQAKNDQIRNLPRGGSLKECKTTAKGLEYMGKMSKTSSGKTCQHWTSNSPHKHDYHADNLFPDGSQRAASNYCRSVDKWYAGPWCYTTDNGTRWELCPVRFCCDFLEYLKPSTMVFAVDLWTNSPLAGHGHHWLVPYNNVSLNVGDVYKTALHKFIAPKAGVYMFVVDGFSSKKGPGCIQLRKNKEMVDTAYTAGGLSPMNIHKPLTVKKGDAVFVTMCPSVHGTLHNDGVNTFTGYILPKPLP